MRGINKDAHKDAVSIENKDARKDAVSIKKTRHKGKNTPHATQLKEGNVCIHCYRIHS